MSSQVFFLPVPSHKLVPNSIAKASYLVTRNSFSVLFLILNKLNGNTYFKAFMTGRLSVSTCIPCNLFYVFSVCFQHQIKLWQICLQQFTSPKKDDRKKLDYFFNSIEAIHWNHMWCFYLGICKDCLVLTDITYTIKHYFFSLWILLVQTHFYFFSYFFLFCQETMEKQTYLGCENKLSFPFHQHKRILWTNMLF